MSDVNFNVTDRIPSVDSENVKNIFAVSDFPDPVIIDGETRIPLEFKTYVLKNTITTTVPFFYPDASATVGGVVSFVGAGPATILIYLDSNNGIPLFKANSMGLFVLQDVVIIGALDPSASTSICFDLTGIRSQFFPFLVMDISACQGFADMGTINRCTIRFNTLLMRDFKKGLSIRGGSTLQNFSMIGCDYKQSGITTSATPAISILGTFSDVLLSLSGTLFASGESFINLDKNLSSTSTEINNNGFDNTLGNTFFRPDVSKSITAFTNNSKIITAFSDSIFNPGANTTVTVADHGLPVGANVDIGSASYDGDFIVQDIIDKDNFDIVIPFVGTESGNIQGTTVTVTDHGLVLQESIAITGTALYNDDFNIVRIIDDDNFDIMVPFTTNEATGTVTSTGLNESAVSVTAVNNGDQRDSMTTGQAFLTGNMAETDIPAVGAFIMLNGNGGFTSDTKERISIDIEGVATYIGLQDVSLIADGNVLMEPASGGSIILSARFVKTEPTMFEVTFTNGTNTINETATALTDGDTLCFRGTAGTLPTGIRNDAVYFVINQATNSFQIAYTSGGSAIAFTNDGTPTNSYNLATLQGSTPQNSISSNSPRDLVPQSLVGVSTNDTVFIAIANMESTTNIVADAFYRLKK